MSEAVRHVGAGRKGVRRAAIAAAGAMLLTAVLSAPAMADDAPTGPPTTSGATDASSTSSPTTPTTPTGDPSTDPATPTPTGTSTDGSDPSGSPTETPTPTPTPKPTSSPATPVGSPKPIIKPGRTPTPNATHASTPDPDGENALSAAELARQLAQAQALQQQLMASNARLAAITAQMQVLSTASSAALQALQTAERTEQQALATQSLQQLRLTELQARADELRLQLGRWARAAYVSGGTLARYQAYVAALQAARTDDVNNSLFLINYVGRGEDQALTEADTLASVQKIVSQQADEAATEATAARLAADQANSAAQAALTQQRALLQAEQVAQAGRMGVASFTLGQLSNLAGARTMAASALRAAIAAGLSTAGASCRPGVTKNSVNGYANGQIPASALCPIWGAPGQMLRADAAAAFDKMSRAYAKQFGRPICVTDSYRSFSQQVALYAAKPNLAARPGTSNHGWGVAVDLCGGVQSFGTAEHNWLFTHAPLFGWFHPSWAEPTGSRPEPWHWEFAH